MQAVAPIRGSSGRRAAPRALAGLVALMVGAACSDDTAPPRPDAQPGGADAAPGCQQHAATPSGACCASGSFYDYATDDCVPVGPAACRDTILASAGDCAPRWCWALRDAEGEACAPRSGACAPRPVTCDGAATTGSDSCAAGRWPNDAGDCDPAGTSDDAVPRAAGLPPWHETAFCDDGAGAIVSCGGRHPACGPGRMPDPDAPGRCMTVGVPWLCPPGFVTTPQISAAGLPGCRPDPYDCGDDMFGDVQDGPDVLFVRRNAAPGGHGTRASPLTSLADAVSKIPTGGTIVLAAGVYEEEVVCSRAMTVRGRCAAMVHIRPAEPSASALYAVYSKGASVFADLTLSAANDVAFVVAERVRFERVHIRDGIGAGLTVNSDHGVLELVDTVISGTRLPLLGFGNDGMGLSILGTGRVRARRLRMTDNMGGGVRVADAGSVFDADGLLIDGSLNKPGFPGTGAGLRVSGHGTATLRSARFAGNGDLGVVVDSGGRLTATGVIVRGTRPEAPKYDGGIGLQAEEGASVHLVGVRISGNRSAGLKAGGRATRVDASGLVVDGTRGRLSDGGEGRGLTVDSGASLRLRGVRVSASHRIGVAANGQGTVVYADRVVVDRAGWSGGLGVGFAVEQGARVVARRLRVADNALAGVAISGPGASLQATDIIVQDTRPAVDGVPAGIGLEATGGARVRLERGRIAASRGIGINVVGAGTRLVAAGVEVVGTRSLPAPHPPHGVGIEAADGADVLIAGCRVHDNRLAGLATMGPGPTSLRTVGTLVQHTGVEPLSGAHGSGLVALPGTGSVELTACVLTANHAAGVSLHGSSATIRDTVIAGTLKAANALIDDGKGRAGATTADGITAAKADGLVLRNSVIIGMQPRGRVGVFLAGGNNQDVGGLLVTGHTFGLVLRDGATASPAASLLFGNDTPRSSDAGLAMPAAPALVPLTAVPD